MAKIQIGIEKCDKCPFHYTERTITADSFECALDYYCGVNKKKIAGYVERDKELPQVPKWCPYRVKEE